MVWDLLAWIMKKLFSTILVLGFLLSGYAYAKETEVSCNGKYQNEEVSVFLSVNEKKEISIKNEVGFLLTEEFMNYNYKTIEYGLHDIDKTISSYVEIYLKDKLVRGAEYVIDHKFKSLKVQFLDYILAEDVGSTGMYSYDLRCKLK
tara:strand:- start:8696 stop:9136 length:441 start_codon:yes stop_codon:yes gene_type:complete